MVCWLRALAGPSENLALSLSTSIRQFTTIYNSSERGSDTWWLRQAHGMLPHTLGKILIHIQIKNTFKRIRI